jgi:N-acetylglucosamine kinase-like BadF-type ATPase
MTARAGGWGYLFGDEGSGYSLGIAALRAAVQAADGRIPPTSLQEDVLFALGLRQVEELVAALYQRNPTREIIARLASVVFTAAEKGDRQAERILEDATSELVKAALAVVSILGWNETIPCILGGGVFQHYPQFVDRTVKKIQLCGIEVNPIQVSTKPVIGAVRLAIHTLRSKQKGIHP